MRVTRVSTSIFKHIFSSYDKNELEEKNIVLAQADIPTDYITYSSKALMNTLIAFIVSLISALLLYVSIPSFYTFLILAFAPIVIALSLGLIYWYLPTYYIKKRGKNIDLFLPYAINFISSMAIAGISPTEIFQSLSTINVYGEIQKEAKKIAKEITIMGTDNITALKNAITISPSKKFRAFLQGIIGTIQSGSDLHTYLSNAAEKYMQEDLNDRKKDLDLLGVVAEVLVLAVIAFPILLVIILTVIGFFSGSMESSFSLLLVFSFLILPTIYVLFYSLIKSTSLERLNKTKPEKLDIKQYYLKNKKSLNVLLLSIITVVSVYAIINMLSYTGNLELNLFLYWDFIFLALLILIGPIGIYNYLESKKKKEMQKRLPEFLNEVGDSMSTGMNIFEAIKAAEKGHYGKLHPEIKKMKSQLSWNISMRNVLFDFATRMKSAIVQRIIVAIDKGLIMGGKTPKIFKAAAGEVQQVNQIEHQRKSIMSVYSLVILVCFFVFLGIILILKGTIFASFFDIQKNQMIETADMIKLSVFDPLKLNYTLYSFVFVQSIGSGILAGFMMDGKLSSGIRYGLLLGIISIFVFKMFI